MAKRKSVRTRGKFKLSDFFRKFKEGDSVSVVRERALRINFPERLQGRTGKIEFKRGRAYSVRIKDQNKEKSFLIEPIHLKKIKTLKKQNDN